jgi:hypothetical protein
MATISKLCLFGRLTASWLIANARWSAGCGIGIADLEQRLELASALLLVACGWGVIESVCSHQIANKEVKGGAIGKRWLGSLPRAPLQNAPRNAWGTIGIQKKCILARHDLPDLRGHRVVPSGGRSDGDVVVR